MKNFRETNIPGLFEIDLFHLKDERGVFVKSMHQSTLDNHGLVSTFKESFYSTNAKGVIRGMHFQHPPYDHAKLVCCTKGKLLDVLLDIRKGSPTYGEVVSIELSDQNFKAIYIPTGIAHGFAVLEDDTCMIYQTSTMHNASADDGIHIDSFDYQWPFENPICSERDRNFQRFKDFNSPFIF